ncbi:beach-domain-containing protein [Neoconidiobolus thromboides FSU 785]|nr:beach-domain-containing protein [Neoconidiobolus thromboides FSU 785]
MNLSFTTITRKNGSIPTTIQGFEDLFNLLESTCYDMELDKKSKSFLCQDIIKEFTALLIQNDSYKQELAKTDGYARLCVAILDIEGTLSEDIFESLFGMLTDCLSYDQEHKVITNKYVIAVLMDLFSIMDYQLQLVLIERMINFAIYSDFNKWVLCNSSITSKLLKSPIPTQVSTEYVKKTMNLLEILGSYSVTISDVRILLKSLCFDVLSEDLANSITSNEEINEKKLSEVSSEYLASHQVDLLEMLFKIAQKREDLAFFQFKGLGSGIIINGFHTFPKSGYSFFTWIRLESNSIVIKDESNLNDGNNKQTLFCFLDKKGSGIITFFQKENLIFQLISNFETIQEIQLDFKFAYKRWYFISISHTYPEFTWGFGQPEINFYINDQCYYQTQLKYHMLDHSTMKCIIGATLDSSYFTNNTTEDITENHLINSFQGQIATIYFANGKIKQNQLDAIYKLGKQNSSIFMSIETKGILTASNSQLPLYIDLNLFNQLIFVFNPKASRSNLCFNIVTYNNPNLPPTIEGSELNAIIKRVEKCNTLSLQNAIYALGGVEILFPMLLKLDALEEQSNSYGPLDSQNNYFSKKGAGNSFFTLLGAILNNHLENQQFMLDNNSALIISILLQQIHPKHLNVSLYQSLVSLVSIIQINLQLESLIFSSILFNLRIWMYASFECQGYILELIKNLTESRKQYFSEKFGIQFFLDLLQKCYYYLPNSFSMPEQHLNSKINRPQKTTQLYQLRSILIDIIMSFLKRKCTNEDIFIISRHLIDTNDLHHCSEFLNAIFDLIQSEFGLSFLKQFLLSKGYETLCKLLMKKDNKIRSLVYDILTYFCCHPVIPEKWKNKIQFGDLISLLFSFDQKTTVDLMFYQSLLKFSIESHDNLELLNINNNNDNNNNDNNNNKEKKQQRQQETKHIHLKVINYKVLISFIKLLSIPNTNEKLIEIIFNDFITLCKSSIELCHQFQSSEGFLLSMFHIITCSLNDVQSETPISINNNSNLDQSYTTESNVSYYPKVTKSVEVAVNFLCVIIENTLGSNNNYTLGYSTFRDIIYLLWSSPAISSTNLSYLMNYKVDDYFSYKFNEYNYRNPPMLFIVQYFLTELCLKLTRFLVSDYSNEFKVTELWIENILNIISVIDTIMFHHRELEDTILSRLWQNLKRESGASDSASSRISDEKNNIEALKRLTDPNLSLLDSIEADDLIYQLPNNPWEESLELTISFLNFLDQMDQFLSQFNNQYKKERHSFYDKIYTSNKNPCKLMLKILISGFSMANTKIIGIIKSHFLLFFENHHPSSLSKDKLDTFTCPYAFISYDLIFPMFGYLHEAFIKIKEENYSDNPDGIAQHNITPLYLTLLKISWDIIKGYEISEKGIKMEFELWENNYLLFSQFCTSKVWIEVYDEYFFPTTKNFEEENFKILSFKAKKVSQNINLIIKKLRKQVNEEEVECKRLNEFIFNAINYQSNFEKQRIAGMEIEKKAIDHRITKLWLIKLQEMTREHGMFLNQYNNQLNNNNNNLTCNEFQTYWKLDFTENYQRMRRRLIFNHEFNNHQDASAKRDKTPMKEIKSFPQWKRSSIANYLKKATSRAERIKEHINSIENSIDKQMDMNEFVLLTEDVSEDSDWNIIYEKDYKKSMNFDNNNNNNNVKEKIIIEFDCSLIFLLASIQGKLKLTTSHLYFLIDRNWIIEELNNPHTTATIDWDIIRDRKWHLLELREIHYRKHLLQQSALEFFFMDQTSYFFNFINIENRNLFYHHLKQLPLPNLIRSYVTTPSETIKKLKVTEKWQKHEISNFEYLMQLNSISGRSYNDLTQYFVFPWILTNYTTDTIDLKDSKNYRDLSKPIGALDDMKLKQSIQMYNEFEDPNNIIKKFHYGTHYSSAGGVAFYLLRLEPFTSIHIALQSGKFDHPDRQFLSLNSCWNSCLKGQGDVKELIPEFFYLPEFLKNSNRFDLGQTQSGVRVDDVSLPPWAYSPEHFIKIHREALESDYVSQNLHHWIDLIFGYKQTGEEAIKAYNTFYYLTYEGAIDLDSIKDLNQRKSMESQIYYFGQTPSKIFNSPHPQRYFKNNRLSIPNKIYDKDPNIWDNKFQGYKTYLFKLPCQTFAYLAITSNQKGNNINSLTSNYLKNNQRHIITIDKLGTLGYHRLLIHEPNDNTILDDIAPFSLEINQTWKGRFIIPSPFAHNIKLTSKLFLLSSDGQYLFSCGHWDNCIKLIHIPSEKIVASMEAHKDIITCCAMSENYQWLVTGSKASSVFSWCLEDNSKGNKGSANILKRRQTRMRSNSNELGPKQINNNNNNNNGSGLLNSHCKPQLAFYGHNDTVTCLAVNYEHDLLVSGSKDGTCIIHSLRTGLFLRSLSPHFNLTGNINIQFVLINSEALIIVFSEVQNTHYIHVYTINGSLLCSIELENQINDVKLAPDNQFLFVVNEAAKFEIFHVFSLKRVLALDLPLVPTTIWFEPKFNLFILGCSDGKLLSIDFQ